MILSFSKSCNFIEVFFKILMESWRFLSYWIFIQGHFRWPNFLVDFFRVSSGWLNQKLLNQRSSSPVVFGDEYCGWTERFCEVHRIISALFWGCWPSKIEVIEALGTWGKQTWHDMTFQTSLNEKLQGPSFTQPWDHPHPWKVSSYPSVFFFTPKEIHGDLKPQKKECAQQKRWWKSKLLGCLFFNRASRAPWKPSMFQGRAILNFRGCKGFFGWWKSLISPKDGAA